MKSHIRVDRRFGFIREAAVTSASAPDGRMLRGVVSTDNLGRGLGRQRLSLPEHEKWLAGNMLTSRIHRGKPAGKPMPQSTAQANAKKSSIRARIEQVFAHQKNRFGLFVRTIGVARAEAKLTLVNLAYNMDRRIFHEPHAAMG